MNHWAIIRTAIIILSVVSTVVAPKEADNINIGWEFVIISFLFFPVIALIGLVILPVIPGTKNSFNKPKWGHNPFDFSAPENFFHLGGYVLVFSGMSEISMSFAVSSTVAPAQFAPLCFGLGILLGLKALTFKRQA